MSSMDESMNQEGFLALQSGEDVKHFGTTKTERDMPQETAGTR
jgi:hypothetical protein